VIFSANLAGEFRKTAMKFNVDYDEKAGLTSIKAQKASAGSTKTVCEYLLNPVQTRQLSKDLLDVVRKLDEGKPSDFADEPARVRNTLRRLNIRTKDDLKMVYLKRVQAVRNCGRKTIDRIMQLKKEHEEKQARMS